MFVLNCFDSFFFDVLQLNLERTREFIAFGMRPLVPPPRLGIVGDGVIRCSNNKSLLIGLLFGGFLLHKANQKEYKRLGVSFPRIVAMYF